MVDYQLSHPFLQTVLPKLGMLIHDKVERVRLFVIDLLLKVKRIRAIKVSVCSCTLTVQAGGLTFVTIVDFFVIS